MKRKLFVCLLALVLIVTLMPAAAFAENTGGSGDSIEVDGPTPEIDPATGVTFTVFKYTYETVDNESTRIPLKGAVFTLTDIESDTVYGPKTSGENGEAIFNNIPDGTYELRETRAPEGYWRNPLPEKYEVSEGTIYRVYSAEGKFPCDGKIEYSNSKPKEKIVKIKLDKMLKQPGLKLQIKTNSSRQD